LEADHLGDKVYKCSNYAWWSWNGGPEALKKELEKCQPLCRFCHSLKSKSERNTWNQPSIIRRQKIINNEKLRVGACEGGCGRVVTPDNVVAFDWAHKKRETKSCMISELVKKNEEYFQKQWPIERAKCKLLCCLCHRDETIEENKRIKN
jgi:hypothetical protein